MARRYHNIVPFSRDYRRPPRWTMGLPPRRPRRPRRLADPRFYLKAVIAAVSLGLVVLPAASDAVIAVARPVADGSGSCRVWQVIDGDTVRMWCAGRGSTTARLTGLDAPELFSPSCPAELLAATRAKWALRLAIWTAGEVVLVREGTDRYGRTLVAAFLDGEPLARRMIAAGHARPYSGGRREGWCA